MHLVAREALVVHVQYRTVGRDRKHCRNTKPEPYHDIKCLQRHTAEQPLSRHKIFCRDRGTVGGLARQRFSVMTGLHQSHPRVLGCVSARWTVVRAAAHTALLSLPLVLAIAPPCRNMKNPIATEDSKPVVAHSGPLHFQFPFFFSFSFSFQSTLTST